MSLQTPPPTTPKPKTAILIIFLYFLSIGYEFLHPKYITTSKSKNQEQTQKTVKNIKKQRIYPSRYKYYIIKALTGFSGLHKCLFFRLFDFLISLCLISLCRVSVCLILLRTTTIHRTNTTLVCSGFVTWCRCIVGNCFCCSFQIIKTNA